MTLALFGGWNGVPVERTAQQGTGNYKDWVYWPLRAPTVLSTCFPYASQPNFTPISNQGKQTEPHFLLSHYTSVAIAMSLYFFSQAPVYRCKPVLTLKPNSPELSQCFRVSWHRSKGHAWVSLWFDVNRISAFLSDILPYYFRVQIDGRGILRW